MLDIKINAIQLRMDESDLRFSFCKGETEWSWTKDYRPKMECKEGTVFFDEALEIHHELVQNGIGKGIRSSFAGFEIEGTKVPYAFETYAWIEETTEDIFFEWVPICEEGITVEKVFWPGEMELEEKKNDWYTLLNMQQGVLIPNDWETELTAIPFDGFFETAGGYMPWFSQFKGRNGYIAICTTPWNAGYQAEHPENGPYTHVGVRFEPSLGRMDYKRVVRYTLIEDGDYNDACKIYRDYVREQGNLCTLNEKATRVASVDDLIGCSFIHKGIKTFVQPESDFFDPENPDKNNNLTPFAVRTKEMKELHELGAGKLYLHLDGWAEPGYDNKHPDYTPACEEAGGWNNCCTGAVLLYGSLCICKNRIPIQECNLCTGVICTYGTGSDIPDPTVPDCSESWTSGHDTGIVPAKLIQCIWNISSETVLYVIAEGTGRSGVAGRL